MNRLSRRCFLNTAALAAAGSLLPRLGRTAPGSTQVAPEGYFTLGRVDGRWFFLTPDRRPFFSLGLNHIDPATLRYPENVDIWHEKYGTDLHRWLREAVAVDLRDWGFNSVGWTQEVITRDPTNHRHSRPFTYEEYQAIDLPYGHMLPFADFHQWEAQTIHPDFFSPGFANWCDHVAREHCVPLSEDSKLIGYWYIDCPTWIHDRPQNKWKGPLFDPAKLESEAGKKELHALATQYYKVTHDAIRRYDPHHLILGDRYEANAPLPIEVVNAARPFVDLLAFQDFNDPIEHLKDWHEKTGMPVLWADGAKAIGIPDDSGQVDPTGDKLNDGAWYAEVLGGLRDNPGVAGAHLCGAYLRNRTRRRGLRDEREIPDATAIEHIRAANRETTAWAGTFTP